MMDSFGLIGHKHTWQRMADATQAYLQNVFSL